MNKKKNNGMFEEISWYSSLFLSKIILYFFSSVSSNRINEQ